MKIIGVTGPSGAGKSMLCQSFEDMGVANINADEVYHSLLIPPSKCLDAIRQAFGSSVFTENGELDRVALSKVVFTDSEKLKLLNFTVLSFVITEIKGMIASLEDSGAKYVIIDAPTLIESRFNEECDVVIAVLSPEELRIKRIMERDGIKRDRAILRTRSQKPDSFYAEHSDFVLYNSGDETYVEQIEELKKKLICV